MAEPFSMISSNVDLISSTSSEYMLSKSGVPSGFNGYSFVFLKKSSSETTLHLCPSRFILSQSIFALVVLPEPDGPASNTTFKWLCEHIVFASVSISAS